MIVTVMTLIYQVHFVQGTVLINGHVSSYLYSYCPHVFGTFIISVLKVTEQVTLVEVYPSSS
jgi:hypothetical protein